MKNVVNVLAILGVILVIYSLIGKFVDEQSIGLGIIKAAPRTGLVLGNSLMLISIVLRQWEK